MALILDIAREANVAPSSVSLVLNGRSGVSPSMRQKVESAMRKLGHKPKPIRSTRNVAFIYTPNMLLGGALLQYCRDWMRAARETLANDADSFTVLEGRQNAADDSMFNLSLDEGDFDGVILMGAYPKHGYIQRVRDAQIPLVVLDRRSDLDEFNSVCVDHRSAGRIAAEHLTSLGHQRIALVTGDASRYPASHVREGFIAGLKGTGATLALDLADDGQTQNPEALVDRILASGATVLFSGDPGCLRIANILHARGVNVPGRISLMGFDGLNLLTPSGLQITSVGYDKKTMGRLAGQMLSQAWSMPGQVTAMQAVVPAFCVPGATTCSPA
jgi:LacI family transcriptional regulator